VQVRASFDVVIIDTSALCVAEDAAMISVRTGAALAVARSAQTRVANFSDMVQGLLNAGVEVVGSVLNEFPPQKLTKRSRSDSK
jgi:protein-tyrosine kinase